MGVRNENRGSRRARSADWLGPEGIVRNVLAIVLVFAASGVSSYAEVMDKEPSLVENWVWSIAGGLLAIAAWRWRWWLGLALTSIALFGFVPVYAELQDPSVGPAIRREAGERYVTHFYLALTLAVVLHATGVYLGFRRQRSS